MIINLSIFKNPLRVLTKCILILYIALQGLSAPAMSLQYDTSQVSIRNFNGSEMDGYAKKKAFIYEKTKKGFSLQEYIKHLISEWLRKFFSNDKQVNNSYRVLKIVFYVFLALVFVFLLIQVLNIKGIFSRSDEKVRIGYSIDDENINEMNFVKLIEDSVAKKEYRYAIRLCYLQSLKILADRNLIDWKIDKTNHNYLIEMRKNAHARGFARITDVFEWVWYGEFSIDEAEFVELKAMFDSFDQEIKTHVQR